MKFLTGYEEPAARVKHSDASGFAVVGDSLTVQADSVDADINVIMDRYARTGQTPPLRRLPSYGDFDGITDYRQAIHAVREAEDLFMQLPAKVRSRFDNDPELFIEFCGDQKNREELADLGLLSKEAADEVRKAQLERRQAEAERDQAEPGRGAAAAARREPSDGRQSAKNRAKPESGAE